MLIRRVFYLTFWYSKIERNIHKNVAYDKGKEVFEENQGFN